MRNPYKFLREKAGYTQKRFCEEFDFAKQTLISIEQGVYEELSDRMLFAIMHACHLADVNTMEELAAEYDTQFLIVAYHEYRVYERSQFKIGYTPVTGDNKSPMQLFVESTTGSVQGLAKKLKVQTAIILAYMTGKQKEMPIPLQEALADAGYAHTVTLMKLQNDWIKNRV